MGFDPLTQFVHEVDAVAAFGSRSIGMLPAHSTS
jgi:hypothetical protein